MVTSLILFLYITPESHQRARPDDTVTRRSAALLAVAGLALFGLLATQPALAQCAMCKATVIASPPRDGPWRRS